MFSLKSNTTIPLNEIELIISKFLFETIEGNTPHIWISGEEPFLNQYNYKVSYDYSGNVERMTRNNLEEIVESLGQNTIFVCYSSELEEMLSEIYINQWTPSYISNHGKSWMSYKDILEEKFNE